MTVCINQGINEGTGRVSGPKLDPAAAIPNAVALYLEKCVETLASDG